MSKQHTEPQGTRRESPNNNEKVNQSHDPRDRASNTAGHENDKSVQEGGGEESKHGRKQKGNVDDA